MPVYDYVCHDCHKTFELILTLKEHEVEAKCPKCGSKNVEQKATAFYAVTGKHGFPPGAPLIAHFAMSGISPRMVGPRRVPTFATFANSLP